MSDLRLRAARARIAEVASVAAAPAGLGAVRLRDDQRLTVSRVSRAIDRDGGCLLADDVGRGKTYVALAVARRWRSPLVVIPASLRATWMDAMRRAGVSCDVVTHEALSRDLPPPTAPDGIIVDESHRFRSPDAKRYQVLARLAAHAPVLLLSATPLQNGPRDLAAQLALFLGSSAFRRPPTALATHVVRGGGLRDGALPAVSPPRWVRPAGDDGAVLRAIVSLPEPAAPIDAGDVGVLRTIGLVRAWASSRAALLATLRKRRRAATAIEQCAASGLAPERRDLRAWQQVGDDIQLPFAPLLVQRPSDRDLTVVSRALATERAALEVLERALADSADPDVARVARLRSLRDEHAGERILAFSEFASTVRAYFAAMRGDAEVGLLTAAGARIASGSLPRDALLASFAPRAQGAAMPSGRERVTLLLSTDLLSEGVNLQDASVVVHLDLPWNPARLAQRVGRVRRPGGAAVVHSYLLAPPARTELLLRVEARLRDKLQRAERTIGRAVHVLPALAGPPSRHALDANATSPSAESRGGLAERIARWRRPSRPRCSRSAPLVAAADGGCGWLAALDDGRLLACVGSDPTDDDHALLTRALRWAERAGRPCADDEAAPALAAARRWLVHQQTLRDCGVTLDRTPLDDALDRRIARAVRRAPRHARPTMLDLATQLRAALTGHRSLGAERELTAALDAEPVRAEEDRAWFERVLAIAKRSGYRGGSSAAPRLVALIVFGRDPVPVQRAIRPRGPTAHPAPEVAKPTLL